MISFVEKVPGLFVAACKPNSLSPSDGANKVAWRIGLNFTSMKREGHPRSDGKSATSLPWGFPWVEAFSEAESNYSFFTWETFTNGSLCFRFPPEVILVGCRFKNGGITPSTVAAPHGSFFPLLEVNSNTHVPSLISHVFLLSTKGLAAAVKSGKALSIKGSTVLLPDSNDDTLALVGYRRMGRAAFAIGDKPTDSTFPFPGTSMTLPGITVVSASRCYADGFLPDSFTVTEPALAKHIHPFLGFVSEGSRFNKRPLCFTSEIIIRFRNIPTSIIAPLVGSSVSFTDTGDCLALRATDIESRSSILVDQPLKCFFDTKSYKGAGLLIDSLEQVVPLRKVARDYHENIPKHRVMVFGHREFLTGFYCIPSELEKIQKINKQSLSELKSLYPWVNAGHLDYSRDILAAHDEYLKKITGDGWTDLKNFNSFFENLVHEVSELFFADDPDVFCSSPLPTSALYYKPPATEKILSCPDAHYFFLAAVRKNYPNESKLFFATNALSVLLSGDLAA